MNHYIINCNPIPLMRPRFGRQGKAYDPQKDIKTLWMHLLFNQRLKYSRDLLSGPLEMDIIFYFKPPKRNKDIYHSKRPDIDNCIKMVLDCCNNNIFKDDAQIASIIAKKLYDSNPRTEFTIKAI